MSSASPDPAGILASAKPDDMVVVAVLSPKGEAVILTRAPDARRLVNLASSLLDQAADTLAGGDGPTDYALWAKITDALTILPDRQADPADAAEG